MIPRQCFKKKDYSIELAGAESLSKLRIKSIQWILIEDSDDLEKQYQLDSEPRRQI